MQGTLPMLGFFSSFRRHRSATAIFLSPVGKGTVIMPICLVCLLSLQLGSAQDFRKSYTISAGGQVIIGNVLGNIKITGYAGDSIEVLAFKKGDHPESIEITDNSLGNRIELHARYPQSQVNSGSVDFEVRVPRLVGINFSRISSFSGNVEVTDVSGRIRAESVRGNVEVKDVQGLVSATSMSGNVTADLGKSREPGNMRFSSISGDVSVKAPANLDALIDMSSASGLLKTDFPIEVQERRYGPGRTGRGRLGSGRQILRMTTVSGNVNLTQK
jgi:hypothetical protein